MRKRKDLHLEIEIPEGINCEIKDNYVFVRKRENELKRKLNSLIDVFVKNGKIIIESEKPTRREKKIFGTTKAHIKNIIEGLKQKFKYKLQVCAVHFPMTVNFDKQNNILIVKNFLGEKSDRKIKIKQGVDINIDKDIIEIESIDKELAGQVAGDIEKATKVTKKDRRVFQDGIFIIEKAGRSLL